MDMNTLKELRNLNKKDLMQALGMERRSEDSILPLLGSFAVGMLAGLGAGILLAPKSGRETREELLDHAESVHHKAEEAVNEHVQAH